MIEEHFGLRRAPFRLGTDVSFYYESDAHRRAMAHLRYGLRQGEGFVVVTGEPGVGKTMVVEHLLMDLDETEMVAGSLTAEEVTAEALPGLILAAFDRRPVGDVDPGRSLHDFLRDERERGLRASLIIDKAHRLDDASLDELRALSNLSHDGEALLQLCLIGQTSLRSVLYRPEMEQFRQRVVASYHLPGLSAADTEGYIRHRMRVAGHQGEDVFTSQAVGAIYRETKGVPQRINSLCGRVLMQAALDGERIVDAGAVALAVSGLLPAAPVEDDEAPSIPASRPADTLQAAPELATDEDEAAEAERTLALLTAAIERGGELEEAGEDEERAEPDASGEVEGEPSPPAEEADSPSTRQRYRGRAVGGGAAQPYPVSVSDINAAIREIQDMPQHQPRRFTSPQELMARAQRPANDAAPPSAVPGGGSDAAPAGGAARATLEAFLAEANDAIRDLRSTLEAIRHETEALDSRRRARRDRISAELERQADRLAALRSEAQAKKA